MKLSGIDLVKLRCENAEDDGMHQGPGMGGNSMSTAGAKVLWEEVTVCFF